VNVSVVRYFFRLKHLLNNNKIKVLVGIKNYLEVSYEEDESQNIEWFWGFSFGINHLGSLHFNY
jgi:hypothetical protein